MLVTKTDKKTADLFVKNKHYARRQGIFKQAFMLVEDYHVVGVAVFGEPPLQVAKHMFRDRDFPLLELVRVVVQTKTKNAASILVGRALQQLGSPTAVVSYADSSWGHCGIIYQATNWLYCGATTSHDSLYLIDGQRIHPRTLAARGITAPKEWAKANGIETVAPQPKHRYVFLCGNKYEKRHMRGALQWKVLPAYPKGDYVAYDDGEHITCPYIDASFTMEYPAMKLSDAIQAGAGLLKTEGPTFALQGGVVALDGVSQCADALTAAQVGILGRRPTIKEHCQFYWVNPWSITPGSDLEMWLRMTAIHQYRWADVIAKLRGYGA